MTDEQSETTYQDVSDDSDWYAGLDGYLAEGFTEIPFWFYRKQGLLVFNLAFLEEVWGIGTDEPLGLRNLERAALKVARLRFPEVERVRISFGEHWTPGHLRRGTSS